MSLALNNVGPKHNGIRNKHVKKCKRHRKQTKAYDHTTATRCNISTEQTHAAIATEDSAANTKSTFHTLRSVPPRTLHSIL